MADTLERMSRDEKCWTQQFHYNWPNLNSMMQQSEITINQQVIDNSEQSDTFGKPYQNEAIPEWNGQDPTHWKAWGFIDSETSTNESLKTTNCKGRTNKACRSILCVFLLLSFVIAVVAAVGLTIFLTQFNNKPADHTHRQTHGGTHDGVDMSTDQQAVLTQIFCDPIKDLLAKTEFPVETGLKDCYASILFVERTGSIHIEMHATPVRGYTIKEKLLRALTEGSFNKNRTKVTDLSSPLTTILTSTAATTTTDTDKTTTTTVYEETTSTLTPMVSTVNQKDLATTEIHPFDLSTDIITTTEESLPSTTERVQTTNRTVEPTSTPGQDSTTEILRSSERTTSKPISISTENFYDLFTESTTMPPIFVKSVTTMDVKSSGNKFSVFKVPVATNLFQPTINEEKFNSPTETDSNSVSVRRPSDGSPKVVESLMAGGVLRLPLRTNSNFRFLFSGNSANGSGQSNRPSMNSDNVKVAIRKPPTIRHN